MKIKEKILLIADVSIQSFWLLVIFIIDTMAHAAPFILLFTYQLFSCIIHLQFPISIFRKIYHWMLLPVLICSTILVVLSIVQAGFALLGVLLLFYGMFPLVGFYALLTFYETVETIDTHEE